MRSIPFGVFALLAAGLATPNLAADEAAQLALGKQLFTKSAVPACALCHTLKDAGSMGAIGPVLDELKPNAGRVSRAMRDGIGQIPSYEGKLTEKQIAAIAFYVSTVSGAK